LEALYKRNISLYVKRDDLIHPEVSGNKWRKLRLNIDQARLKGKSTLVTPGGAHSNHIAATAKAAELYGMESVGIIRGEDADLSNRTLSFAQSCGMKILKISRSDYRKSDTWDFKEWLKERFENFYFIPQGGANFYGVNGCMDIMREIRAELDADKIFVSCGTGTTISGLIQGNADGTHIIGVSALKGGDFLLDEIQRNLMTVYSDEETTEFAMKKVSLLIDYHFGGFAKVKPELINFMKHFYEETHIKLDPIYTAKTAYAMVEKAREKHNKNPEKWVLIHTGGLQGIPAMEERFGEKIY